MRLTNRHTALGALSALAIVTAELAAHADDKTDCINAAQNAQSLRVEKKLSQAHEGFLVCSREVCPAVVRTDCVKWLTEVENATSTVVIRARDAGGHDLVDVRVLVDGKEVAAKLTGSAIAIDPGQHKFRYEAAGLAPIEDTVLVAEGEKGRLLRVDLGGAAGTTTGDSKPSSTGSSSTPDSAPHGKSPVPWIIGGVGLASLVAFGVTEIFLQGEVSSLKDGCGAQPSPHCTDADLSTAKTERTVAEITFGVGLVAVAVAVPWIIVQSVTSKKAEAPPAAFFDFRPTHGGGVGVLGGRF